MRYTYWKRISDLLHRIFLENGISRMWRVAHLTVVCIWWPRTCELRWGWNWLWTLKSFWRVNVNLLAKKAPDIWRVVNSFKLNKTNYSLGLTQRPGYQAHPPYGTGKGIAYSVWSSGLFCVEQSQVSRHAKKKITKQSKTKKKREQNVNKQIHQRFSWNSFPAISTVFVVKRRVLFGYTSVTFGVILHLQFHDICFSNRGNRYRMFNGFLDVVSSTYRSGLHHGMSGSRTKVSILFGTFWKP